MAKKKRRWLTRWFSKKRPMPELIKRREKISEQEAYAKEILRRLNAGSDLYPLPPPLATPQLQSLAEELQMINYSERTVINRIRKRELVKEVREMVMKYLKLENN